MSISKDRRELYPVMSENDRDAVDRAYNAAEQSLRKDGINTSGLGDHAENLVGAIARYIEECRT